MFKRWERGRIRRAARRRLLLLGADADEAAVGEEEERAGPLDITAPRKRGSRTGSETITTSSSNAKEAERPRQTVARVAVLTVVVVAAFRPEVEVVREEQRAAGEEAEVRKVEEA